jgi:hypothetical protein
MAFRIVFESFRAHPEIATNGFGVKGRPVDITEM